MRRQCDITAERERERETHIYFVSGIYVNANYIDTERHCIKIRYTLVRRFTNIANNIAPCNRQVRRMVKTQKYHD